MSDDEIIVDDEGDWYSKDASPPPSKTPDIKALKALAWSQCTDEEMAAFFDLTPEQFEEHTKDIKDVIERGKAAGRAVLKRRQYQLAASGDDKMLTHLGKHTLGQTDKQDVNHKITYEPLTIMIGKDGGGHEIIDVTPERIED